MSSVPSRIPGHERHGFLLVLRAFFSCADGCSEKRASAVMREGVRYEGFVLFFTFFARMVPFMMMRVFFN